MKMLLAGAWVERAKTSTIRHPFDGKEVDSVPVASVEDVTAAIDGAVRGAEAMRKLSARERAEILAKTAALVEARTEEFARTITLEEGKTLVEARFEASRAVETLRISGEEAKRLTGEVLPLDAAPGGAGKLGFTLRVPCGVVAAISPFNFPLNLVCHKLGPAFAGGNAVVLKPATATPLAALKLAEAFLEAGLPPLALSCLTGDGATLGPALCSDSRVRKVSFTGSVGVGEAILKASGVKRVTMELGSNSPVLIFEDADLATSAKAVAAAGFGNAGQTCISAQRIFVAKEVYGDFLAALSAEAAKLKAGDPLSPQSQMGPMVHAREAQRVHAWIREAVEAGARVLEGGEYENALFHPTVVADVPKQVRLSTQELFGPAVAASVVHDFDEALAAAADSRYGLSAAIFTRDLERALRFVKEMPAGNVHVNGGPSWRADLMPYGGFKESGFGKEGPKYAILEMTESKTVVFH